MIRVRVIAHWTSKKSSMLRLPQSGRIPRDRGHPSLSLRVVPLDHERSGVRARRRVGETEREALDWGWVKEVTLHKEVRPGRCTTREIPAGREAGRYQKVRGGRSYCPGKGTVSRRNETG